MRWLTLRPMMTYSTDLSDAEFEHIEEHLPAANQRGRPKIHAPREILNAVFYVLKSGCPWRLLTPRVPALEDRLPLVQSLAYRRHLRAFERRAARDVCGRGLGRNPQPSAGDRGLPDGQDHRGGRHRARLRPGQEGGRQEATPAWWTPRAWCSRCGSTALKCPTQDGIRLLLEPVRGRLARLSHLWVDAGYQGRGKRWAEEVMGLSVEVVRKPPKPVPEEVAERWAREWAKEGKEVDWQRLMPPQRFLKVLPRRWVVERTFSWLGQNRRMSKDYERLAGELGGLRLRSDEPPYGEEAGPCLRIIRQFLEGEFSRSSPVAGSRKFAYQLFSEVRRHEEGPDVTSGPSPAGCYSVTLVDEPLAVHEAVEVLVRALLDGVRARSAVHQVAVLVAHRVEGVVAGPRVEGVLAGVAVKGVGALPAVDGALLCAVVAGAAVDLVVAGASVEAVVARARRRGSRCRPCRSGSRRSPCRRWCRSWPCP